MHKFCECSGMFAEVYLSRSFLRSFEQRHFEFSTENTEFCIGVSEFYKVTECFEQVNLSFVVTRKVLYMLVELNILRRFRTASGSFVLATTVLYAIWEFCTGSVNFWYTNLTLGIPRVYKSHRASTELPSVQNSQSTIYHTVYSL